ncbi:MAG TPA: FkbM family methyltransferase [Devosia sp.]|nr:FkbM family methyltransferase [Devosia sp.]
MAPERTEAAPASRPDSSLAYVRRLGIDIPIDPQVMSWLIRFALRFGFYETKEAAQLEHFIEDGEVVLELGTGIGFVSTVIARNPRVRKLVSYEANPRMMPFIRRLTSENLGANLSKADFRNAVLFNNPTESHANFYISRHFWGSSLMPVRDPVAIEKVRVDDFAKVVTELRPTLIVADIEGGELPLFRDAMLEGVQKIYLEVHPARLGVSGLRELFANFERHGFVKDRHNSRRWVMLFRRKSAEVTPPGHQAA